MATAKKPPAKKKAPAKKARKPRVAKSKKIEQFKEKNKPGELILPDAINPRDRASKSKDMNPFRDYSRLVAMNCLLESGKKSPIEVMFENMWWAHEEAEDLVSKLFDKLQEMNEPGASLADAEQGIHLFKEVLRMRGISQACARDAAPYVHAKLSMIDVDGLKDRDDEIEFVKRVVVDPQEHAA